MKIKWIITVFCLWIGQAGSQSIVLDFQDKNFQNIEVKAAIDAQNLKLKTQKTDIGNFCRLGLEGSVGSTETGAPELPVFVKLLEVPFCNGFELRIKNEVWDSLNLSDLGCSEWIYPAQPSLTKSQEALPTVIQRDLYLQNEFYQPDAQTVSIHALGVMRNIRIAELKIAPVQYNPVQGVLKILRSIDFEVTYLNPDVQKTQHYQLVYENHGFNSAKSQVVNTLSSSYKSQASKNITSQVPLKYIIVSNPMFKTALQPFVEWKKQKGFTVVEAYTDQPEVGTTNTSIRAFLKSHYDNATLSNPAQTFVLLVGDTEQIPAFWKSGAAGSHHSHVTDLDYAEYTDDYFPDCYYGRFSARTVQELVPQINKTINYETLNHFDESCLNRAILIAGNNVPTEWISCVNGQINYTYNHYINSVFGFSEVYKFLNQENYSSIYDRLNQGVGIGVYTAHGTDTGWSGPMFSISNITNMTNTNRYGFFIGNCCNSNRYEQPVCFGEAFLRAENKGAVGYIGASNETVWEEDFYWAVGYRSQITPTPRYQTDKLGAFDKWFHTHNEDYSQWFITASGIIQGGNLAVESSPSNLKQYYWEIYNLMGDPSLMPWIKTPKTLTANYPPALTLSAQTMSVKTVPYSYIALRSGLNILAAAFTDENGNAELRFTPIGETTPLTLVVSAQNYRFYSVQIPVIVPLNAFLNIEQMLPHTVAAGTTIPLNLTLKNIGTQNIESAYLKLYSDNPYLSILSDSLYAGDLSISDIKDIQGFEITVAGNTPDKTVAALYFEMHYNGKTTIQKMYLELHAPQFKIQQAQVIESLNQINVVIKNIGTAQTGDYTVQAQSLHSAVSIAGGSLHFFNLDVEDEQSVEFPFTTNSETDLNSVYPILLTVYNTEQLVQDTVFFCPQKATEDFETENFLKYPWVNDAQNPWIITNSNVHAGVFSARSNSNLDHNQSSVLQIQWTSTIDDSISFYRSVSSEIDYDWLKFAIDDEVKEQISGENPYKRSVFFVSAGTHTFSFVYEKDRSERRGEDCAWIDNITFPASGTVQSQNPNVYITSHQPQNAEYRQTRTLDLTLKNRTTSASTPFDLEVFCDNAQTVLGTSVFNIPAIPAGGTYTLNIPFTVSEFCIDGSLVHFNVLTPYETCKLPLQLHAPQLEIETFELQTAANPYHIIEPNRDFALNYHLKNKGSASTGSLEVVLEEISEGLRMNLNPVEGLRSPLFANATEIIEYPFDGIDFNTNFYPSFSLTVMDGFRKYYYPITVYASINVGIKESLQSSFSVYPNPVRESLFVQGDLIDRIEIYDSYGRTAGCYKNTTSINVAHLTPGVYFIKIESNHQTVTRKIIKL